MKTMFSRMLTMCLAAGWMVPVLCLLRLLLSGCPKKYRVLLWSTVALRLVCPVTVQSRLSLLPRELTSVPISPAPPLWAAWLTGTAVMLLGGFVRLFRLKRKLAEAVWCGKNVWCCDHLPAPFVLGFVRPKIYLPSSLRPDEAVLVLAHEQAHEARLDALWKLVAYLLLSVYWFNPLLWLAYRLFCQDVELACDERVASELSPEARRKYAHVMISCAAPGAPVPGFGSSGLKTRIRAVLGYRRPSRWALPSFVAAMVVAATCFLTEAKLDDAYLVESAANQFFQELNEIASDR